MIFGDGYSDEIVQPFVRYLESHGISTIGIPLLEENEDTAYSDITPENYCKYIDKYIPRFCNDLCLYGISKGCEWLTIYASRRSNVKKLILVEPTTFPGKPEMWLGEGGWAGALRVKGCGSCTSSRSFPPFSIFLLYPDCSP